MPAAGTEAQYRGVGPKGYQRSDPRVREKICERLLLDPYLDASSVVVHVSKGRVALTGTVPSERMRAAAVAAASSVATGAVDDSCTLRRRRAHALGASVGENGNAARKSVDATRGGRQ